VAIPSSASSLLHKQRARWPTWVVLAFAAIVSVGGYILVSAIYYRIGFPLDDAWIHQTYARNLVLRGEWSFNPGKPSGGSTAPLWSALLAIGFLLKLAPFAWTFLLGALALWGISWLGEYAVRSLVPTYNSSFPWVGVALALEWHLVWAASSGMETLLYALLATIALVLIILDQRNYFSLGLLIGISVWFRPDGVTLLGPALLVILVDRSSWAKRLRSLVNLGLGFGSPFAIYLFFNLIVSSHPWPNTFYAKQAEYAVYLKLPLLERMANEAFQPLIGVGIVLLPGVILMIFSAIRRRAWGILAATTWLAGYLTLYAWRLPVTYQHGRYVIPAMPVFFLLGLAGLVKFGLGNGSQHGWILPIFWRLTAGAVLIVFWARGAFSYAQDVSVIESEMVTTAKWVSIHVPANTIVAAHDIGALGYYGKHNLVDLAGLISPEVIPFLRDEKRIETYLNSRGVGCLVAFPDWYPSLTLNLSPIFTTHAPYAPGLGEKNMVVFRWPAP
jgi:hypothetical protein